MCQQSAVQALVSGGLIDAGAFTHWDHLHAAVYELGFLELMLLFVLQQHPNNLCWPDKYWDLCLDLDHSARTRSEGCYLLLACVSLHTHTHTHCNITMKFLVDQSRGWNVTTAFGKYSVCWSMWKVTSWLRFSSFANYFSYLICVWYERWLRNQWALTMLRPSVPVRLSSYRTGETLV